MRVVIARVCYYLSFMKYYHKCPIPLALDGRCSVAGGCPAVKDALHEPLQGDSVLFCIVGSVCCWEVDLVGVDLMGGHHWFS